MRKSFAITIICTVLICLSLVATLLLDESIGSRVATIVTIVTAVIGAIALFLQFRNDRIINRANFLIEYNRAFYNDYKLEEVYLELDRVGADPTYEIDFQKHRASIVAYLDWIETIASLVERGAIDLYMMDNIVSYRFFIITNNKVVQENELVKFKEYYRGTYYLYDKWYNYELKRGLDMPLADTPLCKTEGYDDFLKFVKGKLK